MATDLSRAGDAALRRKLKEYLEAREPLLTRRPNAYLEFVAEKRAARNAKRLRTAMTIALGRR